MSDSLPLPDREVPPLVQRYADLIEQIIEATLKGKIRSKEQVYQMLVQAVSSGTGEVFERCLDDRLNNTQQLVKTQTDEFKLAKATRTLRALQTIQAEWQRWQEQNQATEVLATTGRQIAAAEPTQQLAVFLQAIDPNRPQAISLQQWKPLAQILQAQATENSDPQLQELAEGLTQAMTSWQRLSEHLVSWIYDQSQSQLGFGGVPGQRGPWTLWAKQVPDAELKDLLQALAMQQSVVDWADQRPNLPLSAFVEIVLVFQRLQLGLVNWFDKLVYDSKVGAKLSISTYLTFAILWSQLASGFSQPGGQSYVNGAFQITLQILRLFAQRDYFPLYGGIFASFAGSYLRDTLNYLDEPLRRTEGTQEKARILILLGYSLQAQGQYERAKRFHEQASDIARSAGDRPCEIASLNHLSRTCVAQKQYGEAIQYSQRALVLSRQAGDRPGEANALANLGYSEVFQARQLEQVEPEVYETAIYYLQQGLTLSERLGDRQSQALCCSSLGIAQMALAQYQEAIANLEQGVQAAQFSGDLYLYGLNLAYLAEAHYQLQNSELALLHGCLGMYLLEQIASEAWRQPAGLLLILQGQLGVETFQNSLQKLRSQLIAVIGVDGYDHIPQLLEQYRQ